MKWVYKAVILWRDDNVDLIQIQKQLNIYAEWELVTVDNGVAYFKKLYSEFKLPTSISDRKIPDDYEGNVYGEVVR